jgi:surface antigen
VETPQRSTAAIQHQPSGLRRQAKPKIKSSVIAVYASVFALVITMVSIGYHEPKKTSAVSNTSNVGSTSQIDQTSVDNVVATGVAASVAQAVNLPIATSVANLAVSASSKSELAQSTDSINTVKPQIIGSGLVNRFVTSYTVIAGDTAASVGANFGITSTTIKYANNLTSDALIAGTVLQILPVDGVLYTVKAGDTIDAIATKYKADKTRLVLYNDLDVSGLVPGSKIVLPGGDLPTNERPGYVAPVVAVSYNYAGAGSGFGGRTWNIGYGTPAGPYAHGNCTLYAYNRRVALGLPVGRNWGNASSWAYNAGRDGLLVNRSPSVGAIIQNGGGLGHVGIVESILANGDLSISEMNAYVAGGGYNVVSGRIIAAGNVSSYLYIH